MARKPSKGLYLRGGIWHIAKHICGRRRFLSTATGDLDEAEQILDRKIREIKDRTREGGRPQKTFVEAARQFIITENKKSLHGDVHHLGKLKPFIGHLPLEGVHMGTLQPFIEFEKRRGVKNRTINLGLQTVRRILNLAAGEWFYENGMTWLHAVPRIKMLSTADSRQPFPLSFEEVRRINSELPGYCKSIAMFMAYTGAREGEACGLRWQWEVAIGELKTNIFIIPGEFVKNTHPNRGAEDRADLLGHRSGRSITRHYSAPDISRLIDAANRIGRVEASPGLTLLNRKACGMRE